MAAKTVETTYSLRDEVTARLGKISAAFGRARQDNERASEGIERANLRSSASFEKVAVAVGKFRSAIAAVGAAVVLKQVGDGIVEVLKTGERFDDLGKKFATAFGGLEQGKRALEGVKAIAENVPLSLEEVGSAAVALRQRGFDPLDGTLQALIDNTVALDGNAQDLMDTIGALGKASLRGEVGTRALVSLTEKGIPVFQLLSRALGKTEAEIRAMAAGGKLGSAEIKLLIGELGKLRAGAAASEVGDLDAQLIKLRDTLALVKNNLAQGGSLETARQQFADLNEEVRRIAASPEFKKLEETFTETFDAGVDAVRAFIDNFDFAEVIAEIEQTTGQIRDLFKILKASDVLVEPLLDAVDKLTLPTQVLKLAVATALRELGDLVDGAGKKVAEAGSKIEGTVTPVSLLRKELALAKTAIEAFDDAQRALKGGLTVEAKLITDQLGFLEGSAEQARAKVAELFKTFQTDADARLGDVALGLAEVGSRADNVAASVRDGLGAELKKLSGEDLLRFQTAAKTAFETMEVSATEAATVLDTTLAEALSRLGVSGELLGQKITASGNQIIATFKAVVENARATSEQIEAAFSGALANTTTIAEAQALGAALAAAGERGQVSLEAMARSAIDLKNRLLELQNAADPLADAFKRLGIQSQRELDRIAEVARGDFASIETAARSGGASLDDVSRAFEAMARAQLAATANASKFEQESVRATLRAKGETLGLTDALVRLGIVGEEAGAKVAGGADAAAAGLRKAEAAAQDAAAAAEANASANDASAGSFIALAGSADQAGFAIEGVSEKFRQLAEAQTGRRRGGLRSRGESDIFEDLQEQNRRLHEEIARTRDLNAQHDETEQRIRNLRGQYDLLSDERIRQLAEEQRRLEDNAKRQEEQAQRQREAQERASSGNASNAPARAASTPTATSGGITVNVNPVVIGDRLPDSVLRGWGAQIGREIEQQQRRRR